jgi:replicative DNA helicase Mcm
MPKEKVERINSITSLIKQLEKDEQMAKVARVLEEAEKSGMDKSTAMRYINELERSGDIYSPRPGVLKLVRHDSE